MEQPPEQKLKDYLFGLYYWPVRPVANETDQLVVTISFHLKRIIQLSLKDQLLTIRVVIEHEWRDYKLQWDPKEFNGITEIELPSEKVWLPELHQYNGLGNFNFQSKTVHLYWNGIIRWYPVVLFQSFCPIEVQYYPFDIQLCKLVFGTWTYASNRLLHIFKDIPPESKQSENINLTVGMNLDGYQHSLEWDLISIPAIYTFHYYSCCKEGYTRIYFEITLRRKSLFYLVNLIFPLVGLSYLSILAFYLPAECGEKITLCVSLLTSQVTFLLLMIDNIPVTSLAVPLLGKVIIFCILTTFLSLLCTTIILNIHYSKPTSHSVPNWIKTLYHNRILKKILFMKTTPTRMSTVSPEVKASKRNEDMRRKCSESEEELRRGRDSIHLQKKQKALQNIRLIREYIQLQESLNKESEYWKHLAAVMDRICLVCFNCVFFAGIFVMLMNAHALFDMRNSLDE